MAALTVLALAGCTTTSEPPPTPPSPTSWTLKPAPPAAEGSTLFGAHWDWNRYDAFEPYLKKLAGSSTYYELSWCDVEKTQGSPDWAPLDKIAQRSKDLGIRLDLKIRVGLCWATGGTPQHVRGTANKTESAMPLDMKRYQAFVTTLVKRYRPYGVTRYAIENEVNAQQYWAGTPEQYGDLVRAGAEAIHAGDPEALVVDSGISSVALGMGVANRLLTMDQPAEAVAAYNAYFARRIGTRGKLIPAVTDEAGLRTALGQAVNQRNLAYLAETKKLLDARTVQIRQLHYYEHPEGIPALLQFLKVDTPQGVPIEAWEVGRFDKTVSGEPADVAAEMSKVVTVLAAGGITGIVWLPLAYNPNNRAGAEVRAGLLDPDGKERPAGVAMATMAEAARGANPMPINMDGVTGVGFTSESGTRLLISGPKATSDQPTEVVAGEVKLVESTEPSKDVLDSLGR